MPGHNNELQAFVFCPKNEYSDTKKDNKNKLHQQT